MRRREFLAGLAVLATCRSVAAFAQGAGKPSRIGFLGLGSPSVAQSRIASLRQGLADLGYKDGRDYVLEPRIVGADYGALSKAAVELAGLGFDVLVTHAGGAVALKQATRTTPIVMISGDAVATGLVDSLQRPGGNITGISFFSPELMAKRLELLKEVLPAIADVGVLATGADPVGARLIPALEGAAQGMGVRLHPALIRTPGDLEGVFAALAEKRVAGIVVQDEPMIIAAAKRIAELAARHNSVAVGFLDLAAGGGAIGYSIDFSELYRRAAGYVVKILQGARPDSLPVEQPTKFHLAVNARAMKALGIETPLSILARADEVIE